ncbi:hypothetical protein ASPBRDRAFT_38127 [Aspergillus brasiliensis CBS 101740]|uniref:Uncharacterized protein n=1 Tax=Aspergillus brasiliensis (strain CBS 101740 / IMI 381727 / IBT 21946) TaxID=767769 RepID=A0A1L9UW98_ASPBC|nr:hypothetical protein ASPBRDRAFT_38127 [Aspergillus brasiliensis CBS 101740]
MIVYDANVTQSNAVDSVMIYHRLLFHISLYLLLNIFFWRLICSLGLHAMFGVTYFITRSSGNINVQEFLVVGL